MRLNKAKLNKRAKNNNKQTPNLYWTKQKETKPNDKSIPWNQIVLTNKTKMNKKYKNKWIYKEEQIGLGDISNAMIMHISSVKRFRDLL